MRELEADPGHVRGIVSLSWHANMSPNRRTGEGGGQGISADGWMELLFDEDAQNFPYIYIMCLSDIIKFTIEFSAVGYELRPLCVLGVEKTCCERRIICYR